MRTAQLGSVAGSATVMKPGDATQRAACCWCSVKDRMLRRNPLAAMALHHPSRHLAEAMPPAALGHPEAQLQVLCGPSLGSVTTPSIMYLRWLTLCTAQLMLTPRMFTWTERPPGGGAGNNRQHGRCPVWGRPWRTHHPQGAVSSLVEPPHAFTAFVVAMLVKG